MLHHPLNSKKYRFIYFNEAPEQTSQRPSKGIEAKDFRMANLVESLEDAMDFCNSQVGHLSTSLFEGENLTKYFQETLGNKKGKKEKGKTKEKKTKEEKRKAKFEKKMERAEEKLVKSLIKESKKQLRKKGVESFFDKGAEFFRSADGKIIVYAPGKELFISEDGNNFYELSENNTDPENQGGRIKFENLQNGQQGNFKLNGDTLVMGGVTFSKVKGKVKGIKSPEIRGVEYAANLPNGQRLIVTHDRFIRSYRGSFQLHIDGSQVPVQETRRYRDGNTTIIETSKGQLFIPSTWSPKDGEVPTWNDEEIELIENEQAGFGDY